MSQPVTTATVAIWMQSELERQHELSQEDAVENIMRRFGRQFTYVNDNGNDAIAKDVLKAFKALTVNSVVWDRSERCWRKRTRQDEPGRQQD